MNAADVADRLGAKQRGGSWMAKCPAHEDKTDSLSIGSGNDGKVLLKCMAGCDFSDVVRHAGLEKTDLFPDNTKPTNGKPRIVAEYDYRDEQGKLLRQVVRMEPKTFRQRQPEGSGWNWSTKGVRQVPYRLPELVAADASERLFIVEGEKDVDRLVGLGLAATCSSGGAGKWPQQFAEHFKGRSVVILPDNDGPGRDHATQIAESLLPVAKSVTVVELPGLPPKGDVSDWLDNGGGADELLAVVRDHDEIGKAKPAYVTVTDAIDDLFACSTLPVLATPFSGLNGLLGGGFIAGQVAVVNGGTGAGKTALVAQIAAHAAKTNPVMIASYELPPRLIAARIVSQAIPGVSWLNCIRGAVDRDTMLECLPSKLVFANRPSMDSLKKSARRLLEEYGQAPLIIIDYLQLVGGVIGATERISDLRAANQLASDTIRDIADELKAPTLVVSSVSRGSNVRIRSARDVPPGELVDVAKESGSIEYDAGAVIVLSVSQDEDEDERRIATVTVAKNRFGRTGHLDFRFAGAQGLWIEIGEVEKRTNDARREQIIESVKAADLPLSKSTIIKRGGKKWVKGRKADILADIDRLVAAGDLHEIDGKVTLPNPIRVAS